MGEYIPDKQEIAYHEAGHAVTGYLFFPPVELVSVLPENKSGRSAHGTTKCNIPFPDFGEPDIEKEFPKYLKIIINALSGKYFQSTIRGIDDQAGAASDYGFLSIYIYDESYIAFKPIGRRLRLNFAVIRQLLGWWIR